jgi:hypothetical protein
VQRKRHCARKRDSHDTPQEEARSDHNKAGTLVQKSRTAQSWDKVVIATTRAGWVGAELSRQLIMKKSGRVERCYLRRDSTYPSAIGSTEEIVAMCHARGYAKRGSAPQSTPSRPLINGPMTRLSMSYAICAPSPRPSPPPGPGPDSAISTTPSP